MSDIDDLEAAIEADCELESRLAEARAWARPAFQQIAEALAEVSLEKCEDQLLAMKERGTTPKPGELANLFKAAVRSFFEFVDAEHARKPRGDIKISFDA